MSTLDAPEPRKPLWTWRKIRVHMKDHYGVWYSDTELRALEVKWKRAFADAGWTVKGE